MNTEQSNLSTPSGLILPHDLLVVSGAGALSEEQLPAWAQEAVRRVPMVVVRRAKIENGLIPVGVRGNHRGERVAALLPSTRITKRIYPEYLVANRAWWTTPRALKLQHFSILNTVADVLNPTGLAWGPVGGIGFELASDHPCLTEASDIDLVLRAPKPFSREVAAELHAVLCDLPVRIDVQVEVPAGAIALAEIGSAAKQIVLRTESGPRLIEDPWQEVMK